MSEYKDYVLVIGSSNMDLNIYSERLPKLGETVTGGVFKQCLGGKGANQAVASVRSGAKTMFIGKIGNDSFGEQMNSSLTDEGIDMTHVIKDPHFPSGVAFIMIDRDGENMISVAPGSNARLTPEEIKEKSGIIKNAKVILVQMELSIETIKEIYHIASTGNAIKILNPAPLKPIPENILNQIDIIIPNEGELFRLHTLMGLGEILKHEREEIIQASKKICSKGVKTITTTLGRKGCIVYESEGDKITQIPAIKVKAVDTVGASPEINF